MAQTGKTGTCWECPSFSNLRLSNACKVADNVVHHTYYAVTRFEYVPTGTRTKAGGASTQWGSRSTGREWCANPVIQHTLDRHFVLHVRSLECTCEVSEHTLGSSETTRRRWKSARGHWMLHANAHIHPSTHTYVDASGPWCMRFDTMAQLMVHLSLPCKQALRTRCC